MDGVAENFVEAVAVVDLLILVEELKPVECVVGAEGTVIEYAGEGVPVEVMFDEFVYMFVMMEEF